MFLHAILPLSITCFLFVDSYLFVHLLQVALTTPFLATDEMALLLQ
jgi:hypothetical protein